MTTISEGETPLSTKCKNLATKALVLPEPGDPKTVPTEFAGKMLALSCEGESSRLLTESAAGLRMNFGSVIFQRY
jgi:hypothetical protein